MKISLLIFLLATTFSVKAQRDSVDTIDEIRAFQTKLNHEYKNRDESPLEPKAFKKFKSHVFFPINLKYRVHAKIELTPGTPFLPMKTTIPRVNNNRIYGYLLFALEGKDFRLPVYQTESLMKQKEYSDYLFFPFTDLTNGKQTYGGGRYVDLRIPPGDTIVVDFNKAYNPYCAYSHRFSCPLVPVENQLDIEIPAGVMYEDKNSH